MNFHTTHEPGAGFLIRVAETMDATPHLGRVSTKMRHERRCYGCDAVKPFGAFEQGRSICKSCERPGALDRLLAKMEEGD